jgi:hypothetical protein
MSLSSGKHSVKRRGRFAELGYQQHVLDVDAFPDGHEPRAGSTSVRPTAAKAHVSPKPKRHIPRHAPSSPPGPKPKTFAWLQVAGAAGYRVAFFTPSGAILFRDTKAPQLTLPGTWRYQGKRQELSPGRYRWYVWTLDASGRPSTRAVVNSALVIGR